MAVAESIADLRGADVVEAKFHGANICGANLQDTMLDGAIHLFTDDRGYDLMYWQG